MGEKMEGEKGKRRDKGKCGNKIYYFFTFVKFTSFHSME
jgi:hypothetical protein